MATAPALLSIDEYLRTSYHPDVHFVDGELEERNVGEYSHSKVQHSSRPFSPTTNSNGTSTPSSNNACA